MANPPPPLNVLNGSPIPSPRVPKSTLIRLIQTISGTQTVWATDPTPQLGQGQGLERAFVKLSLSGFRSVGVDELRQAFDETTQQNVSVLLGNRQFTLTCKCASLEPRILEAYDLAERIRFRMRTQVARGIFVPAYLSLRDMGPVVPAYDRIAGSQVLLAAALDIRFNWLSWADPLDPNEGGWIETVNGGGIVPFTVG
jgi:hypothetical protein